jgi:Asp-tRNA(Asn)/Glu-tRNA(Gln) amidotransferase A subunit family amidase
MHDTDIAWLSAHETGELIDAGQLSPVEVTEALMDRITELNPRLNAFVTVTPERAMADAHCAEDRARRGERIGPLDGVPHSIKDMDATQGIRTTGGSMFTRDHVPDRDSVVAERMRSAGSPLLGKTNVPHMGYKDMTDNLLGPPARNPWDPSRTPGGSSGGAAAAVAAGLGAMATGSDGAGSIRIPSAFTGVVGVKPSFGRVPLWPTWDLLTAKGPITRTVLDAALVLDALSGPDRRDPSSIDAPRSDFVAATRRTLAGLRVAWSPDFGHVEVAPEVADACQRAALRFADLGCDVTEVPITWGALAEDVVRPMWAAQLAGIFAERAQEHPEWVEPSLHEFVREGRELSAVAYERALSERVEVADRMRRLFEEYDLLLSPTMPDTAWPADQEPETPLFARLGFTFPFNLSGLPAVSVPCGLDRSGRPIGLQIAAGWHRDDLALAAAARFEEAHPWPIVPNGL